MAREAPHNAHSYNTLVYYPARAFLRPKIGIFNHHGRDGGDRLSLSVIQAGSNDDISLELFTSLANALTLPLDPKPYSWRELGTRLHYATDGRIAYVKQLLVSAYSHAMNQSDASISVQALGLAFTTAIWPSGIGALNPFHADFVFRALDRLGEPFQMGEMGGGIASRRKK